MKINKEELYKLYMDECNNIAEECDWVTHFTAADCVNIVASVLEKNPELIEHER
jgi:hypothetical protein